MAAALPDLSVTISQRRWACVLDPTLTLSRYGVMLVQRLSLVLDIWVVRELWHILDNTQYYLRHPEALLPKNSAPSETEQVLFSLRAWERVRMETDPAGQRCYWIGDGPVESYLPAGEAPEIVSSYERLSASLDLRLGDRDEPLAAAFRDAAALTGTLLGAFLLTQLPEGRAENPPPAICSYLGGWRIRCRAVARDQPLLAAECDCLRQLIVQAGLAKLCWAGLRLAVVHVVLPQAAELARTADDEDPGISGDAAPEDGGTEPDPWQDALGFWYAL